MKQKNPFIVLGYNGPKYFCDRKKETAKLIAAIENDRNVTLIAPRRYGKTGLLHHVHRMMPQEFTGIYLPQSGLAIRRGLHFPIADR